jgi:glucose/arabinose dehydrogenase
MKTLIIITTCLFSVFTFSSSKGTIKTQDFYTSEDHRFSLQVVAKNLGVPWGFDFLPDKKIVLTEREGPIKIIDLDSGKITSLEGVPPVYAKGQGGMMDILVHPQFNKNKTLFFSFSKKVSTGYTTVIAKGRLEGKKLVSLREIFHAIPANKNTHHYGSRLALDKQGFLFFTVGDRGMRHQAQSLKTHMGKVLRIHQDGRIPKDNPFTQVSGARGEIWSTGHRNPQGLTFNPQTGDLWEQEHGPRGGDEINIIEKGVNYGWPVVTYGKEYWGPSIGEGAQKKGMKQPITYWVPSIAPCGLSFYRGDRYKAWKGSLFSGALRGAHLNRLVIKKGKVVKEERLLEKWGERIRNVKEGPEGYLYISVDSGSLFKLLPFKDKKSAP